MILSFPKHSQDAHGESEREGYLSAARSHRAALDELLLDLVRLEEEYFTVRAGLKPWDPPQSKRRLWELEDRLPELKKQIRQKEQTVVAFYGQLLELDDDCVEAHAELADLYWRLITWTEDRGDLAAADEYAKLLALHDDGRYVDLIEGTGTLTLKTEPLDADVRIYPIVEQDRRLVRGERKDLGQTPIGPLDVEPGSYVLEIRAEGCAPVRRPLLVRRGTHLQLHVKLFASREVGPDYLHVGAGCFEMGGDFEAEGAGAKQRVFVDNFAISRYPVTVGEYLLFLDDLAAKNPAAALRYTPRYGNRESTDPRQPVAGVSAEAAKTYAEWLSARKGQTFSLPTEAQWEKAARGLDARAYPWGDNFDASFCHSRQSVAGRPTMMPIGSFAEDISVYGARDMAGLVNEWTDSAFFTDDPSMLVARGGSFEETAQDCRVARRMALGKDEQHPTVGFRLVRPLAAGGGDTVSAPVVPTMSFSRPVKSPSSRKKGAEIKLLARFRELAKNADADMSALLAEVIQNAAAERGFIVELDDKKQPRLCDCCNASADPIPDTDQQFDAEAVVAAITQQRTVEMAAGLPLLAIPFADGEHCLLLERRFSAAPFVADDRQMAETAADLLSLAHTLATVKTSPTSAPAPINTDQTLEDAVAQVERELLTRVLDEESKNISRTARRLGLSRNGLRARMKRYDI